MSNISNRKSTFSIFNALVTIVTLLCLIFGTCLVVHESYKIAKTGVHLMILNDNAQYYNENVRKTDGMTEEYLENNEMRQEIYNSEDVVIRVFSNLPTLIKLFVWILAMIAVPFVPFVLLINIVRQIFRIKRRCKQRRRRTRREVNTLAKSIWREGIGNNPSLFSCFVNCYKNMSEILQKCIKKLVQK